MASMDDKYYQVIDELASDMAEEVVHYIDNSEEGNVSAPEATENNIGAIAPNQIDETSGDTVILVPPLLTAGRDKERISISVEEVNRRVNPPESLCTGSLLGLLRLNRQKGKELTETFAHYGINRLSKRSAVVSSFTRLSETEAAHLAEDYYFLASRSLKVKEISDVIVKSNGDWDTFEPQANMTKAVLEQILSHIETKDTDLNMATHGFSPLIIRAVVDILIEILTKKT